MAALALLSACAGGSTAAPSTAAIDVRYVGKTLSVKGRLVTAAHLNPMPRYAGLVPDALAKSKYYEYINSYYDTYASIFDYPKSTQQIGSIAGIGGQSCTDALYGYGKKTFWNIESDSQITLYEVPKKPIRSLSDSSGMPSSCAMDLSGDLAVGILSGTGAGDVVIYRNATGTGKAMSTPLIQEYFDGYDVAGNLFADGWNSADNFQLVELPKGAGSFEKITTSNSVKFPGSVQWDGTYLTVFDQAANSLYRYSVSGTTATLHGTVTFTTSSDCAQTWIVKQGIVYCADAGNNDGEVFNYPGGGSAIAVFTGNFDLPLGTVATEK
ncbi:MAG TPA: hypothetical protein VMU38_06240 [Candidatus Binatia bacterium]|nr:hypothetical protein [Candidatus Binatia bacterium]